MSLPKITYPIFDAYIAPTKRKIMFRPFTVKEEKILLIADESESVADKLRAARQVVNNCIVSAEPSFDIHDLPAFELEYCFIKIRAKSIGNIIELKYKDNGDNKTYSFEVDLDKLELTTAENQTNVIEIGDIIVTMKYPTVESLVVLENETSEDIGLRLLTECIDTIYDGDNSYKASEYSKAELVEFIESIPADKLVLFNKFFEDMPVLQHTIRYTNANNEEREIVLQGLNDFF